MKYMKIDRIPAGTVLAKDIVTEENQVLVRNGTTITDSLLGKLKERNYGYLYIKDEFTDDIIIDEIIPQTLKSSTIAALKKMDIESTIENGKKIVDNILSYDNISAENYDTNIDAKEIYEHSILVAELSVAFGKIIGLEPAKLNDLAVAALLHDIGKLCTNKEEIEKLGVDHLLKRLGLKCSMEEYDEIMHSFIGYSLLNKNAVVSATIKQAVLMHHERADGMGLLHFPNEKIGIYGKIIHICDAFSRLITNSYSIKVNNTSEVIEYLRDNSGKMFDEQLAKIFVSRMPIYPPGMIVQLSNGMNATICKNNKDLPTRPIVILDNGVKLDLKDPNYHDITVIGVDLANENVNYKTI